MSLDYSKSLVPIGDKNEVATSAAFVLAYNNVGTADLLDIYESLYINFTDSADKSLTSYYSRDEFWDYLQDLKARYRDTYQGIQGETGLQGPLGYQGPTGYQGYKGAPGVGYRGYQGIPGPQGSTGIQGPRGYQGLVGEIGFAYQGAQGLQGYTGIQGTQGTRGVRGVQGLQGLQGAQGPQGIQGPTGITNFNWETVSGLLNEHQFSINNGELIANDITFDGTVRAANGFFEE